MIYAAGLTYKKHLEDSGEDLPAQGPLIFLKGPLSLTVAETEKAVSIPSQDRIYAYLDAVEPGISRKLKKCFSSFPLMFDYEAELGLCFSRDVKKEELLGASLENAVSLFAANDLTLRSVQILGDGQEKKYTYWEASKSFPGFLPMGRALVVNSFALDKWPQLQIRLTVNGELRQNASSSDILYAPRALLASVLKRIELEEKKDFIPAGTVFITGTTTGTAFKLSKGQRFIGSLLSFARVTKLKLAAQAAKKNSHYLKAGDQVIVEVEGLGQNCIRIVE